MLDIDGCLLWSTKRGSGIPVILLNGGPGCDDYLWDVSAMLEPGCEVVRFEPRGCGRSDFDGNYDFDTLVSDVDRVRSAYGFEQVVLVGHSFGPDVGLACAIRWPDRVLGLVGIAGGRVVDDRSWHAAYEAGRDSSGERYPKAFVADPRANRMGADSYKAYIRRPDLLADIARVSCPVTYIMAGSDIRPNWPARQLAALIDQGEYVEIEGAAHCIWMTHPGPLKRQLDRAVERIASA